MIESSRKFWFLSGSTCACSLCLCACSFDDDSSTSHKVKLEFRLKRELFCKWKTKFIKKCSRVSCTLCLEFYSNLETMWFYNIKLWNLREYCMFFNTEIEVSCTIKSSSRYSTKVSNTWKNDSNKLLEKSIHSFSAKCYHHTNRHSLSELKIRNRKSRMINSRELSSNK